LQLYQISLSICFPTTFRSSLHGKGLNRFWSNIEGYLGPLLLLISATGDAQEDSTNIRKWIICALTHQGFENRDMFYGNSGTLYAICPVFHAFSPSGMWFKWLRGERVTNSLYLFLLWKLIGPIGIHEKCFHFETLVANCKTIGREGEKLCLQPLASYW